MARREDYAHWGMGLPMASEALQDLDAVCGELGLTRGELSRLILITWSKARRGTVQHLWGFTSSGAPGTSGNGSPGAEIRDGSHAAARAPTRRKKVVSETAAAAAQGLNLDLDG